MKKLFASMLFALAACSTPNEPVKPDPGDVKVLEQGADDHLPTTGRIEAVELPDGTICRHVRDRAITTSDGRRVSHRCGPDDQTSQTVILDGVRFNQAGQLIADTTKMRLEDGRFVSGKTVTQTARIASIALDSGMLCQSVGEGVNVAVEGQPLSYDCGGLGATVGLIGRVTDNGTTLAIQIARLTQAGDAFEVDAFDTVDLNAF